MVAREFSDDLFRVKRSSHSKPQKCEKPDLKLIELIVKFERSTNHKADASDASK